jgi:hypothetical protein
MNKLTIAATALLVLTPLSAQARHHHRHHMTRQVAPGITTGMAGPRMGVDPSAGAGNNGNSLSGSNSLTNTNNFGNSGN